MKDFKDLTEYQPTPRGVIQNQKKSPGKKQIPITITYDEYEILSQKADEEHLPIATFIKRLLKKNNYI